ncbi:hypothetical protein AXG93_3340s1240 [Marchantia polymorpha subsp. ruderalis]|uniref:Uncharacterized protein n=1 Tax=Marchantia polymorpha subsp. ruderalis TaxID=1480154 RepID=A0A176VSS2_MARPO|nr:hypothetical protein AXG93_3340s1240 [Marchantia polymorpha subsp. ruderalis]
MDPNDEEEAQRIAKILTGKSPVFLKRVLKLSGRDDLARLVEPGQQDRRRDEMAQKLGALKKQTASLADQLRNSQEQAANLAQLLDLLSQNQGSPAAAPTSSGGGRVPSPVGGSPGGRVPSPVGGSPGRSVPSPVGGSPGRSVPSPVGGSPARPAPESAIEDSSPGSIPRPDPKRRRLNDSEPPGATGTAAPSRQQSPPAPAPAPAAGLAQTEWRDPLYYKPSAQDDPDGFRAGSPIPSDISRVQIVVEQAQPVPPATAVVVDEPIFPPSPRNSTAPELRKLVLTPVSWLDDDFDPKLLAEARARNYAKERGIQRPEVNVNDPRVQLLTLRAETRIAYLSQIQEEFISTMWHDSRTVERKTQMIREVLHTVNVYKSALVREARHCSLMCFGNHDDPLGCCWLEKFDSVSQQAPGTRWVRALQVYQRSKKSSSFYHDDVQDITCIIVNHIIDDPTVRGVKRYPKFIIDIMERLAASSRKKPWVSKPNAAYIGKSIGCTGAQVVRWHQIFRQRNPGLVKDRRTVTRAEVVEAVNNTMEGLMSAEEYDRRRRAYVAAQQQHEEDHPELSEAQDESKFEKELEDMLEAEKDLTGGNVTPEREPEADPEADPGPELDVAEDQTGGALMLSDGEEMELAPVDGSTEDQTGGALTLSPGGQVQLPPVDGSTEDQTGGALTLPPGGQVQLPPVDGSTDGETSSRAREDQKMRDLEAELYEDIRNVGEDAASIDYLKQCLTEAAAIPEIELPPFLDASPGSGSKSVYVAEELYGGSAVEATAPPQAQSERVPTRAEAGTPGLGGPDSSALTPAGPSDSLGTGRPASPQPRSPAARPGSSPSGAGQPASPQPRTPADEAEVLLDWLLSTPEGPDSPPGFLLAPTPAELSGSPGTGRPASPQPRSPAARAGSSPSGAGRPASPQPRSPAARAGSSPSKAGRPASPQPGSPGGEAAVMLDWLLATPEGPDSPPGFPPSPTPAGPSGSPGTGQPASPQPRSPAAPAGSSPSGAGRPASPQPRSPAAQAGSSPSGALRPASPQPRSPAAQAGPSTSGTGQPAPAPRQLPAPPAWPRTKAQARGSKSARQPAADPGQAPRQAPAGPPGPDGAGVVDRQQPAPRPEQAPRQAPAGPPGPDGAGVVDRQQPAPRPGQAPRQAPQGPPGPEPDPGSGSESESESDEEAEEAEEGDAKKGREKTPEPDADWFEASRQDIAARLEGDVPFVADSVRGVLMADSTLEMKKKAIEEKDVLQMIRWHYQDYMVPPNSPLDETMIRVNDNCQKLVDLYRMRIINRPRHVKASCDEQVDPRRCCWNKHFKLIEEEPDEDKKKEMILLWFRREMIGTIMGSLKTDPKWGKGVKIKYWPQFCLNKLTTFYEVNEFNPYAFRLTPALAEETGMHLDGIKNWIRNRRAKAARLRGQWIMGRLDDPFLYPLDVIALNAQTNLTERQIKDWLKDFKKAHKNLINPALKHNPAKRRAQVKQIAEGQIAPQPPDP